MFVTEDINQYDTELLRIIRRRMYLNTVFHLPKKKSDQSCYV